MEKFNWKEFLKTHVNDEPGGAENYEASKESIEQLGVPLLWNSVVRHTISVGFALALFLVKLNETHPIDTPLFGAIGSMVSLVSLAICWAFGGILWTFTGCKTVYIWAEKLMPFAVEPYRSAGGCIGFFIILAIAWKRLAKTERLRYPHVNLLKWFFRVASYASWGIVICFSVIKLIK